MADNWFSNLFDWGDDDVTYEDDPYGIGKSLAYDDIFNTGDDSYTDLSLDDILNFNWDDQYGDLWNDDGWENGFNTGIFDDPNYLSNAIDNDAFVDLLMDFDFDDPDADWVGGINSLLGYGDPDDEFGIGRGMQGFDWYDPSSTDTVSDFLTSLNYGADEDEGGIFSGDRFPRLAGFVNSLLGSRGTGENEQGSGIMGLLNSLFGGGGDGGGLLGGGGLGTLGALWALNKARKEGSDPGAVIPMGQQTYGMDDVYGGPTQDYRVFNIQPALMPGVAYANVGKPEGMKDGGKKDGPGDITPAWLEPGEFVVTKKAVDNMGARNLYRMMKEAEGMG